MAAELDQKESGGTDTQFAERQKGVVLKCENTRVGTLIVATLYLN